MTYDHIRRQELEDGIPSTQSEWDRADALQRGEERPDQAWVLTDRDVWHANPFYKGPPQPHPESWENPEGRDLRDALLEAYQLGQMTGDTYGVWRDGNGQHWEDRHYVRSASEYAAAEAHGWTFLCEVA